MTVLHRRDRFDASAPTIDRFAAMRASGAIGFVAGVATGFETEAVGGDTLATEALATEAVGIEAVSIEAVDSEAAATKAVGTKAVNTKAVDVEAVPIETGGTQAVAGDVGFPVGNETACRRLTALVVDTAEGETRRLPVDRLLVLMGLAPKLGPIARWGVALEKKQVVVDPARFETDVPGVHAIGDACTYPGKKKLILCGFHEAALAAYAIAERLRPERARRLDYTTTSPRLHRLLGVAGEAPGAGIGIGER